MILSNLIYSILLTIFYTKRFWGIDLIWYITPSIAILGICIFFYISKGKFFYNKIIKYNFILFIIPLFYNILYSSILWIILDFYEEDMIKNLFSSNLYLIIYMTLAISVFLLFGKKSVDIAFKSACISYIVGSIIAIIIKYGFIESLKFLLVLESTYKELVFIMEVHDLTFAFGIFFIYYFFYHEKGVKRNVYLIISTLMILWGFKRIEIAALLFCMFFSLFLSNTKKNILSQKVLPIVVLSVYYTYIIIIHNGYLIELADYYNISFMGRLNVYSYVVNNYSDFSLYFPGRGVGFIDEIIDNLILNEYKIGYSLIFTLHSDTLRMYIGLGFIGFAVWILYYTYFRIKIMNKLFKKKSVNIYILITIYLFILYLTDNTYVYALTNFTVYIVLLATSDLLD